MMMHNNGSSDRRTAESQVLFVTQMVEVCWSKLQRAWLYSLAALIRLLIQIIITHKNLKLSISEHLSIKYRHVMMKYPNQQINLEHLDRTYKRFNEPLNGLCLDQ